MEENNTQDIKDAASEGLEEDSERGEEKPAGEVEDFKKLYEESLKTIEEGDLLKGIVMAVDPEYVTVDIGYKSEGQISISEFKDKDGNVDVRVGDEMDVLLERKEDDQFDHPFQGEGGQA